MRMRPVLLAVLLFAVPCGGSYFFATHMNKAEPQRAQASAVVAQSAEAPVAANPTTPPPSAGSEGVMNIDNLPVDPEQAQQANGAKAPPKAVAPPKTGEKSFDEMVAENAAAAARKGALAETVRTAMPAPSASAATESAPAPAPSPEPEAPPPPPPEIDREAAMASLRTQAQLTRACRSLGAPPATEGQASVTFAPNGHVKSINISSPFSGTPLGNCIKSTFKDAHAPPFVGGSPTTLSVPFEIPE